MLNKGGVTLLMGNNKEVKMYFTKVKCDLNRYSD